LCTNTIIIVSVPKAQKFSHGNARVKLRWSGNYRYRVSIWRIEVATSPTAAFSLVVATLQRPQTKPSSK
jgi:hypothetical protein